MKKAIYAAVILVAVGAGVYWWHKTHQPLPVDDTSFCGNRGYFICHSVSADGKRVAMLWEKGGFGVFDLSSLASFQAQEHSIKFRGEDPDGTATALISPDGETVLTGGLNGFITEWKDNSRQPTRRFQAHQGPVIALAWCPNGKEFLSTGNDKVIKLWDAQSGSLVRVFSPKLPLSSSALAVSPDGQTALSAAGIAGAGNAGAHIIQVWAIPTGALITELDAQRSTAFSVAFSSDGKMALAASGRTVRIWKVPEWTLIKTLEGTLTVPRIFERPGVDAAFTPDGRFVFNAQPSGLLLWDVNSGEMVTRFENDRYDATNVTVLPDGQQALSIGVRGIYLWDLHKGKQLRILKERVQGGDNGITWHEDAPIRPIAFLPKTNHLLSVSTDGTTIWDTKTFQPIRTMSGCNPGSSCLTKDGSRILSVNPLGLWYTSTGKSLWTTDVMHYGGAISDDGSYAIVGKYGGPGSKVEIWDTKKGVPFQTYEFEQFRIDAFALSSDNRLATATTSSTKASKSNLIVWDIQTGKIVHDIELSKDTPRAPMRFSPDSKSILLGDGPIQTWDLATGQIVNVNSTMSKTNQDEAIYSSDNRLVAIGGRTEPSLIVCDVKTGALLWKIPRLGKFKPPVRDFGGPD